MADLPLRFALHHEGNSDQHFLPVLIRRAIERVAVGRMRYGLDVADVIVVNEWNNLPPLSGAYQNRVLEAA